MKIKQIYFAIIPLLLLGLGGCKKSLVDQYPSTSVTEEATFQTIEGFDAASNGLYASMLYATSYIGGADNAVSWISTLDLMADNLVGCTTGRGTQRSIGSFIYNANNPIGVSYDIYSIARQANLIIKNKDNIPNTDQYYAEALAVRGMVHFDLMRFYCKSFNTPGINPDAELGMPYAESTDSTLTPARGTLRETYNKVVADLTKSLELIGSYNSGNVGKLNKASINGILARVYLWGKEYDKCIAAATASLSASGNVGDPDNFGKVWTDEVNTGVLFKVINEYKNMVGINVAYYQTSGQFYINEWVVPNDFYQLYKSTDIRKNIYMKNTTYPGASYHSVVKYDSKADASFDRGVVDIKYLRVAEVLLSRAEAYSETGDEGLALADLNKLRENRYTDYEPGTESGQSLKDAIALERRLELAFEGDRWFDIKRKYDDLNRSSNGDRANGSGTPPAVLSLPASDYKWQLPISVNELNGNPSLVQNSGY